MHDKDLYHPVIVVEMGDTQTTTSPAGATSVAPLAALANSTFVVPYNDTGGGGGNFTDVPGGHVSGYSRAVTITLAFVLSVIILVTLVGNVLVCLSPFISHKLRTPTYTFLVSLAIADFLLGITVLPFSAFVTVTKANWIFGPIYCNIYVSCDVMFCTSSILHLLVISLDRYVAITRPYLYQRKMSRRIACAALAIVWTISLLISFLPLHLGWNTRDGKVQNYEDTSKCGLDSNRYYALFDGIVLFFIPLILMTFVYIRLVNIANKQARAIKRLMIAGNNENAEERAHRRRSVDEHRALKIIAIVMGCFVVCWVPYFTQFTFHDVSGWNLENLGPLDQVLLWLGYLNSLVNPIVYACMNREFRLAFKRLLTCMRWTPPDESMDTRYCTNQYSTCRSERDRTLTRDGPKNGAVRYSTPSSNQHPAGNGSNTYTLQIPLKKNGIYMKLFKSSNSGSGAARPEPT